jgi:hypothetical protein
MNLGRTIALVVMLTWVAVYLMVSFVTWQIDASQWEEGTRFMCVFLSGLLSPFAVMVAFDISPIKDKK